jgi:glycosyltransferase involved in cell wall biosynthesis
MTSAQTSEVARATLLQTPAAIRVLFVIPGSDTGSSMVFARRQAESLGAEGISVECFYLRSRTSPAVLLKEFMRFREVVRNFAPDVIHAQFGTVTALFSALASSRKTPLVVTFRGTDLNWAPNGGLRGLLGRLFSQLAALRADRVVCVSHHLRSRLWWRRRRAKVMPSGVDTHRFRPFGRLNSRSRLGWGEEERVVLFNAGHNPRNKRLDLAEAAARLARYANPNIRLEVLRGATDPRFVPLYMNAADCLLVTSDSEGSPTVVQEALACCLPIVSVDVGDVRERIHGVAPSLIAAREPAALARALLRVVEKPVRSNGREKTVEISLSAIARELRHVYESVKAAS